MFVHLKKQNLHSKWIKIIFLTHLHTIPHNCMTQHDYNTIIKFADGTTMVRLITENNETAYRAEVRALTMRCKDNNLSLNVIKTKEMIVDYRKRKTEHAPILING